MQIKQARMARKFAAGEPLAASILLLPGHSPEEGFREP